MNDTEKMPFILGEDDNTAALAATVCVSHPQCQRQLTTL